MSTPVPDDSPTEVINTAPAKGPRKLRLHMRRSTVGLLVAFFATLVLYALVHPESDTVTVDRKEWEQKNKPAQQSPTPEPSGSKSASAPPTSRAPETADPSAAPAEPTTTPSPSGVTEGPTASPADPSNSTSPSPRPSDRESPTITTSETSDSNSVEETDPAS